MKIITFSALLMLATTLSAQTEKGASPRTQNSKTNTQYSTHAVVVGISNYQANGIPDLQYAHRDAEVFAGWLRSPAGGNLPDRNVTLLLNEKATSAQFAKVLEGLIENAREGDQVIIYFSGHGDVETKTRRQSGFLLCYDAPASTYTAGGTYALYFLQSVIETLSQDNKAQVLVITDACRAGKLAGNHINGAQLTSVNLAQQFANETKILSCEPNEYSLEGEQWGGGRGLFSYHLVDGLTGMADANRDGLVHLREIQRYLQDRVPVEAEPASQNPMVVGSATERVATVDAPTLANLVQERAGQRPQLSGTDMRGWEDDLVAATDSATQALYYAYKGALEHGALIDTAAGYPSAADLLPLLLQRENLRELHGLLRRNLAAALQDEAQQALNALLDDDPYEHNHWQYNPDKYARYPEYIAKAIELLGERHYMRSTLMAKKLFFEAKNTSLGYNYLGSAFNLHRNIEARAFLAKALEFEPDAAYLYYGIGNSYINDVAGVDSFFYYQNKAIELAPAWMMPRVDIASAFLFNNITEDWASCEVYLLDALKYKPDSYVLLEKLAWLYQRMIRTDDVVAICEKMNRLRPDLPNGMATLSTTYMRRRMYSEGLHYAREAIGIDSSVRFWVLQNQAYIYATQRQYEESFRVEREMQAILNMPWFGMVFLLPLNLGKLEQARYEHIMVKYPFTYADCNICEGSARGSINFKLGEFGLAKSQLLKTVPIEISPDPTYLNIFTTLGRIYWIENNLDSAEYFLKKAVNYHPKLFAYFCNAAEFATCYFHYARFLIVQNRFPEAEVILAQAEKTDPRNPLNYYGMAILHAAQKHDRQALDQLAKALEWYYPDYDEIMAEPLFGDIRKTKRFRSLMQQYFPNGSDKPRIEALLKQYLPDIFRD
ncbi:MAG: caspase family protein [Lewinellaceae bacterium]|nr:caspase family protein [Lewinellaceae bacterium]